MAAKFFPIFYPQSQKIQQKFVEVAKNRYICKSIKKIYHLLTP